MRRRLFTIASAASLLLCVVTLIAWLLSFFAFAPFGQFWTTSWGGNGDGYKGRGWIALDGSIHLLRDDRTMDPPPTSRGDRYRHSGIEPVPGVHLWPTRLGFVYASHISRWRERGWGQQVGLKRQRTDINQQLSFPIWLPAIVLCDPADRSPRAWQGCHRSTTSITAERSMR